MSNDNAASKSRFLRNWILNIISWGLPLALAFVVTPILVRGLGAEEYGIYVLILGFLSYAFSAGIGRVAGKYVPEFRASGEPEKLSEAVSATVWFALAVGAAEALILAAAAPFIVRDILLIAPEHADLVVTSLYVAGLSGLILMVSQVFQFSLQGLHRFDLFAIGTNAGALVSAIGSVWLVKSGYGVLALVVFNGITVLLTAAFFYIAVRPKLPEWKLSVRISRSIFSSVARYSGSIIIYQTLTSVLLLFERSWIVRKFGTETLSYYAIPMMLSVYMHSFVVSFSQVLFPVVNELLGDRESLIRLYKRATKLVLVITALILAGYIGSGENFLRLWISPEFAERSYDILVILGFTYGVNIMSIVVWLLAEAFKAPGLNALSSAIWAAAAIPLMVFFAGIWQSEGVALARFAGVILTVPLIFYIEKRFFGRAMWGFWAGVLVRIIPAGVAAAVIQRFVFGQIEPSWPGLIMGILAGSAAFAVAILLAGTFTSEELDLVRARVPFLRNRTVA